MSSDNPKMKMEKKEGRHCKLVGENPETITEMDRTEIIWGNNMEHSECCWEFTKLTVWGAEEQYHELEFFI